MLPLLSAILSATLAAAPPLPTDHADTVAKAVSADRLAADIDRLVAFGTRHTLSPRSDTRGIRAAATWLGSQFAQVGTETKGRVITFQQTFRAPRSLRIPVDDAELTNVIAIIPARDVVLRLPDDPAEAGREFSRHLGMIKFVCVTAHYDSRASDPNDATIDAPGANDDGSGTVAALELCRVIAKGPPLEHSVVIVLTAGEEQGLVGAKHFVDTIKPHAANLLGAYNMDIVGDPTGTPRADGWTPVARDRIRLFSEGVPKNAGAEQLAQLRANAAESDSPSRQLARYLVEIAAAQKLDVQPTLVFRQDRFLRGGDHIPFNDEGLPAVRLTQVHENYDRQHQDVTNTKGDIARHVDKTYLAGVTRLVTAGVVHLAQAPAAPHKARIVSANLGVTTTLRWTLTPPAPGPPAPHDLAGYEVVWRETTSPVWQHARDVGQVGEVTLDISKDDHFFGVRAYDGRGYRSLVVFAVASKN